MLSCAYDVVTDWRHFEHEARVGFVKVMHSLHLSLELQNMAMALYDKEVHDNLTMDGLDRGSIALRFTLKVMGCETERQELWGDLDEIGRLCQIVDDVLDYEHDLLTGDKNCLASINRDDYLRLLITKFNPHEVEDLFGSSRTGLIVAIERARAKAELLMKVTNVCEIGAASQIPFNSLSNTS